MGNRNYAVGKGAGGTPSVANIDNLSKRERERDIYASGNDMVVVLINELLCLLVVVVLVTADDGIIIY